MNRPTTKKAFDTKNSWDLNNGEMQDPINSPTIYLNAIRDCARSYYPHVYIDSRNISKAIVDLQAGFEVCYDFLMEYDRLVTEMANLGYAAFGLEQALFRAISELEILRSEIRDLMSSLEASEKFNLRLLDQLVKVNNDLSHGIQEGKKALAPGKVAASGLGSNLALKPERFVVPPSTKDLLNQTLNCSIGSDSSSAAVNGVDSLLKHQLNPNTTRLQWLNDIQRQLANRHSEFSFFQMGLWTETVRENHQLNTLKKGSAKANAAFPVDGHENMRLANFGRIEDATTVLANIQTAVFNVGTQITDELNNLRKQHFAALTRHNDLTREMSTRRSQLIDNLMASHNAVQSALDLDNKNDTLVGKLVKTRPLFSELYRVIQDGASTYSGTSTDQSGNGYVNNASAPCDAISSDSCKDNSGAGGMKNFTKVNMTATCANNTANQIASQLQLKLQRRMDNQQPELPASQELQLQLSDNQDSTTGPQQQQNMSSSMTDCPMEPYSMRAWHGSDLDRMVQISRVNSKATRRAVRLEREMMRPPSVSLQRRSTQDTNIDAADDSETYNSHMERLKEALGNDDWKNLLLRLNSSRSS